MSAKRKNRKIGQGAVRYVVDFATTCSVEVWANSESEAKSIAEDTLADGSGLKIRDITAQFWENAQPVAVSIAN